MKSPRASESRPPFLEEMFLVLVVRLLGASLAVVVAFLVVVRRPCLKLLLRRTSQSLSMSSMNPAPLQLRGATMLTPFGNMTVD